MAFPNVSISLGTSSFLAQSCRVPVRDLRNFFGIHRMDFVVQRQDTGEDCLPCQDFFHLLPDTSYDVRITTMRPRSAAFPQEALRNVHTSVASPPRSALGQVAGSQRVGRLNTKKRSFPIDLTSSEDDSQEFMDTRSPFSRSWKNRKRPTNTHPMIAGSSVSGSREAAQPVSRFRNDTTSWLDARERRSGLTTTPRNAPPAPRQSTRKEDAWFNMDIKLGRIQKAARGSRTVFVPLSRTVPITLHTSELNIPAILRSVAAATQNGEDPLQVENLVLCSRGGHIIADCTTTRDPSYWRHGGGLTNGRRLRAQYVAVRNDVQVDSEVEFVDDTQEYGGIEAPRSLLDDFSDTIRPPSPVHISASPLVDTPVTPTDGASVELDELRQKVSEQGRSLVEKEGIIRRMEVQVVGLQCRLGASERCLHEATETNSNLLEEARDARQALNIQQATANNLTEEVAVLQRGAGDQVLAALTRARNADTKRAELQDSAATLENKVAEIQAVQDRLVQQIEGVFRCTCCYDIKSKVVMCSSCKVIVSCSDCFPQLLSTHDECPFDRLTILGEGSNTVEMLLPRGMETLNEELNRNIYGNGQGRIRGLHFPLNIRANLQDAEVMQEAEVQQEGVVDLRPDDDEGLFLTV